MKFEKIYYQFHFQESLLTGFFIHESHNFQVAQYAGENIKH